MDFISTKEAAVAWGVSQRRIVKLANEGRIPGAKIVGANWMIPADTDKPADGRTKSAKAAKQADRPFRFPLFLDAAESHFLPPLSDEEKQLRQAQVHFHACRFDDAREIFAPLSESAESRHVRICALFHLCQLAVYYNDNDGFAHNLNAFYLSFAEDFPNRKDMLLFRYRLDANFGSYSSVLEGLRACPSDTYHPTACDTATCLSIYALAGNDPSLMSKLRLEVYELACMRMEHDGHLSQAQELHISLIEVYWSRTDEEMALRHMRRAFEIALEHELLLRPATVAYYYPTITRKALSDFPADFAEKMRSVGHEVRSRYVKFFDGQAGASYWSILSDREFAFISLAVQGYSNKQIARTLGISEKTVSKRFGEIYSKLGVENKPELVELITDTHKSGQLDFQA